MAYFLICMLNNDEAWTHNWNLHYCRATLHLPPDLVLNHQTLLQSPGPHVCHDDGAMEGNLQCHLQPVQVDSDEGHPHLTPRCHDRPLLLLRTRLHRQENDGSITQTIAQHVHHYGLTFLEAWSSFFVCCCHPLFSLDIPDTCFSGMPGPLGMWLMVCHFLAVGLTICFKWW